ncbi:hypothetical protein ABM016_16125 [Morganella morganii]|uniref:hypothetical protein n=1 Tax=Morganella TaxID=581 RepID=UPI00141A0F75|nr:hypothetical protein [Morganella morganii]NIH20441.1 hypothetical protein [Morganella morganii]
MSDNDDILNSIKSSFQSALDIVAIKRDIENEITNIIGLIKKSTDDVVYAEIESSESFKNSQFFYKRLLNYDKIITLNSNNNNKACYFLCSYSLNKSTGFPVVIRYKNEEFSCNTTGILKQVLKDILTSPETAMAMANLFNGKDADY